MGVVGELKKLHQMMGTPDVSHVACMCRAALAHCGVYKPNMDVVELVVGDEASRTVWCQPCLDVFYGPGCSICGCKAENLCQGCDPHP